jgi:hypothetical protein
MQKDSYKMKLTRDQLNVVHQYVELASRIPAKDFAHKLLICQMICIHKKTLVKWSYPKQVNTLKFSASEAIAFWLMFENEDFTDSFVMVTMRAIINDIHKQFI